jgi:hypothetical protein
MQLFPRTYIINGKVFVTALTMAQHVENLLPVLCTELGTERLIRIG